MDRQKNRKYAKKEIWPLLLGAFFVVLFLIFMNSFYKGVWNRSGLEEAVEALDQGLEEFPDVSGIMCGNDDIASQVINTLAESRRAGSLAVVGQDGDLAACQRIVEGTQSMTVYKQVEKEAEMAAECAVKLAGGQEIDTGAETMNDGSYDVPCILIEPVAVTKENLDEVIIDGGVYSREDVYLNVHECQ